MTIPACFCRGTRILTEKGEVAVEQLRVGDSVVTTRGAARPVRWIGIGHILVTRSNRETTAPIIVRANAIADGVPRRDLRLTEGHALFLDDVLIPVEQLLNDYTILHDERYGLVEFFHVELDDHDVLVAEGASAESYRDTGNGALFENARDPDAPKPLPCAPILNGGPVVNEIWTRIRGRAGPVPGDVTDDPDLHLLVDGRRVDKQQTDNGRYVFCVERRPSALRIMSRSSAPIEVGLNADRRRLGVALERIVLRGAEATVDVGHRSTGLGEGFYSPEANFRWTNGNAELAARLFAAFDGPIEVELHIAALLPYMTAETGELQPALSLVVNAA